MKELSAYIESLMQEHPVRVIVSKPAQKSNECKKVDIHRYTKFYQMERRIGKQMFHENVSPEALGEALLKLVPGEYRQINAFTQTHEWMISITKKGDALCSKKKTQTTVQVRESHNREKQYLIREGQVIPPLVDMGIFTKEGKVVASMQDKFRQINRFIEAIHDLVSKTGCTHLNVIDFGCGKGYLTFLLYYYLVEIQKIPTRLVGIDLKQDVMEHCQQTAKKYGYDGMEFICQDIRTYQPDFVPDIIVSLHACDIATDYVLYHAVQWGAKMIFSMPCCQHELNHQMQSDEFSILTRYGLLQEKTAALFTDAIRGNLLTSCGYRVQIMEIVNPVDTPKNIMIRAEKANVSAKARQKAWEEVCRLQDTFHLSSTMYRLLEETQLSKNPLSKSPLEE